MRVNIINKSNNQLPAYETASSAGMDLRAFVDTDVVLKPFERKLIPTGLYIELPDGYEAQIRPRSGLAIKSGITVLNSPGTIDADYRGEIKVILINLSNEDFTIKSGERICQMVIAKHEKAEFIEVETISETERGAGGFGHTGKQMSLSFYKSGVLGLALTICGFAYGQEPDPDVAIFDDDINYTYNFFEADKNFIEENFDLSESYYQLCLNAKPDNPFLYYRLASIALQRRDLNLAESYIDRCLELDDKNEWYLFMAGNVYMFATKFDKAEKIFTKLIDKKPNEFDFYACLADVYIRENNLKKALSTYDLIEKKFGIDESISIQKKNIYLQLKKKKNAEAELVKLINACPEEIHFKRILADFYVQTGEIEKSISIYKSMLQSNPNDGFTHLGLAVCYQYLKDIDNFFAELNAGFASTSVACDMKVGILVDMTRDQNLVKEHFEQIFKLAELLIQYYPEDPDANTIYADFQMNKGNFYIARLALQKVVETRKDKYGIWEQLLHIDYQLVDWNSMYKHSTEALEYFPNIPIFYFFNGISSFQLSRYEQAKKSLDFGYKILPKNDLLEPDYLTFLGEVYYKLDDKTTAYSYFDKLLTVDPDNLMVMNNYSYYLSLDRQDLPKAKSMSFKTIQKEPENATYLDTYAWILFEMQQYSEALKYIQKAVDYDVTRSGVIIEHYGDILYFNDDAEGALEQWKRVKTIGNGSDKLDEKIAAGKYIE